MKTPARVSQTQPRSDALASRQRLRGAKGSDTQQERSAVTQSSGTQHERKAVTQGGAAHEPASTH